MMYRIVLAFDKGCVNYGKHICAVYSGNGIPKKHHFLPGCYALRCDGSWAVEEEARGPDSIIQCPQCKSFRITAQAKYEGSIVFAYQQLEIEKQNLDHPHSGDWAKIGEPYGITNFRSAEILKPYTCEACRTVFDENNTIDLGYCLKQAIFEDETETAQLVVPTKEAKMEVAQPVQCAGPSEWERLSFEEQVAMRRRYLYEAGIFEPNSGRYEKRGEGEDAY